jgi:hypothetical protein
MDRICTYVTYCNFKGKKALGHVGVDSRIILKWTLKKCGVNVWNEFIWLRIGER